MKILEKLINKNQNLRIVNYRLLKKYQLNLKMKILKKHVFKINIEF